MVLFGKVELPTRWQEIMKINMTVKVYNSGFKENDGNLMLGLIKLGAFLFQFQYL